MSFALINSLFVSPLFASDSSIFSLTSSLLLLLSFPLLFPSPLSLSGFFLFFFPLPFLHLYALPSFDPCPHSSLVLTSSPNTFDPNPDPHTVAVTWHCFQFSLLAFRRSTAPTELWVLLRKTCPGRLRFQMINRKVLNRPHRRWEVRRLPYFT